MVEPPILIDPPNKPLVRVMKPSKTFIMYDFLNFIDVNSKGQIIVGSSSIASTYLEGSLVLFNDISSALQENYASYYISHTSTSDAKFINNGKYVLLAEDNGSLKLLNTAQPSKILCDDFSYPSSIIERIAVWDNNCRKAITCGETVVSIWDVNEKDVHVLRQFKDYHTADITSVDTNKEHINCFASTSVDRKACVWDDRSNAPAAVLYANEFCSLTSVSWNPSSPQYVAVGSAIGDVYLLDIRQPKEFTDVQHCYDSIPIHRVIFNHDGKLAVCGATPEVVVIDFTNNNVEYRNTSHRAVVRGLAWNQDKLYSCGFDKKIVEHTVAFKAKYAIPSLDI